VEAIMNKETTTLKQRVDAALQQNDPALSDDIAVLIEEAAAGIAKADEERAVDQALLSNLQARYQQLQNQERATAWLIEHDALKRERDALAEELREVYPNAVAKMIDLFGRITANDESLSGLHRRRLFRPSCTPAASIVSLGTRRRFLLRYTYLIGTAAAKTGHRSGRQWQRSLRPWCRLTVGAARRTGGWITSSVPPSSRQSNSEWLTTMLAQKRNRRHARMQRHVSAFWPSRSS
jgi:hypothetical protein